jgi:uncharacterized protein (TIGR02145 family)
VLKSECTASFKAVYKGGKIQTGSIQYAGSEKPNSQKTFVNQLKSATSDITLAYTDGDIIHYSFFSGVNSTIVTDIPAKSKTINAEFVKCIDNDNKSYKTVKIGNQIWIAENLAYLPSVCPSSSGSNTDPYYYVYDYQGTNVAATKQNANYTTYGVLYNWPAAKTACPPGWHWPIDDEWTALITWLGGESVAGKKMKETRTAHWLDPNTSDTNESGFSALPGDYRHGNGHFYDVTDLGYW